VVFPGVGKSHFCTVNQAADSDSSTFSWSSPGVRNPEFPANYMPHITTKSGIVMVSSHIEVREALSYIQEPYALCYPAKECKEEYVTRYINRGSPKTFVDLISINWESWITALENDSVATQHIVLSKGEYMTDRVWQFG
jgi:hypothetical protein